MSGEFNQIKTQIAFDPFYPPCSLSRTERRRSRGTSPFDGPERQHAEEMIGRMAAGDEAALADFYQRFAPMLRRGMLSMREAFEEQL